MMDVNAHFVKCGKIYIYSVCIITIYSSQLDTLSLFKNERIVEAQSFPCKGRRSLSEAAIGHRCNQGHRQRLNGHHDAHGTIFVVSEVASIAVAEGAALFNSTEIALRQATTFNTIPNNAHEALVLDIEESAQSSSGCNFLSTGVIGWTRALMAVQSVLREDRTVAPALVGYVMAELTIGIRVAVGQIRNTHCRRTASLDFTVDYPGEAGVVIGTMAISHHEGSFGNQTVGLISAVADKAEICAYGCHHTRQGDHHQEALHCNPEI